MVAENTRGKLIVLFGIDGCGKTTMLNMLKDSQFENTIFTRAVETPVFNNEMSAMRDKFNIPESDYFSNSFRLMLWINDVVWNVMNNIVPALESGVNVIVDRYTICSRVTFEVLCDKKHHCLVKMLDCLPTPDLSIYLDVDVDESLERMNKRNKRRIFYENKEKLTLFKQRYESIIAEEHHRVDKLDANRDPHEIYKDVLSSIRKNVELCTLH